MSLLLRVPDQHDLQDPSLELDPGRLHERLSAMPGMDSSEAARQLLLMLEPLNEQRMEAGLRLRLLEVYRPFVQRLYAQAEPIRLRQQPLSTQARQQVVDDIERLCLAMADGYKLLVREIHDAGVPQAQRERLGQVARQALCQLVAALVHSYRYHRPEPPLVFLELNQLYRLARHHGLHDSLPGDAGGVPSLAMQFVAVSLLALVDPFSAEEGQVDLYHRSLLQHAAKVRVVPANSWQGVPEGLFIVDLVRDARPRHCVFLESPVEADDPCILDARAALEAMHKTLLALAPERRRQRSETAILRHLLPEIVRDKRRAPRMIGDNWIEVVTGLDNIHDWLCRVDGASVSRWVVIDRSDSGYRLGRSQGAARSLDVGELLCVTNDGAAPEGEPRLFCVRWLRDLREKGLEVGVQAFEGCPAAVSIRVQEEGVVSEPRPALFFASGTDQAARLVSAPGMHAGGRALCIEAGGREVPVRCASLLERTACYDCFEFTAVN